MTMGRHRGRKMGPRALFVGIMAITALLFSLSMAFADGPGSGPLNDDTVVTADINNTLWTDLEPNEAFGQIHTGIARTLWTNANPTWGPGNGFARTEGIDYNVRGNVNFNTQVTPLGHLAKGSDSIAITNMKIGVGQNPSSWVDFTGPNQGVSVVSGGNPTGSPNGVNYAFNLELTAPPNTPAGQYTVTLRFTTSAI